MSTTIDPPLEEYPRSLTSIYNSKSAMCIKTEFSTPFHIGFTSLSLINSRKVSSLIACKAMFVKPQTDIKGLNIANDCLSAYWENSNGVFNNQC
ncbi:hypothetical protein CsSME_00011176 [Camellia sinensis var. sinensis]